MNNSVLTLIGFAIYCITAIVSDEIEWNRFVSSNYGSRLIRHQGGDLFIHENDGSLLFFEDSTFRVVEGLNGAGSEYVSFQSINYPNHYIAHTGFRLKIREFEDTPLFKNDASFREGAALNGRGDYVSFEASNYPNYYIRHRNFELWLDQYQNTQLYKDDASWSIYEIDPNPKIN